MSRAPAWIFTAAAGSHCAALTPARSLNSGVAPSLDGMAASVLREDAPSRAGRDTVVRRGTRPADDADQATARAIRAVAGRCPGYHLAPWTALCGRLSSVFPMPRPDLLHDPRRTGQIGGFGRVWLSIPHAHAPAWIDTTAAGSTALLSRPSLDGVAASVLREDAPSPAGRDTVVRRGTRPADDADQATARAIRAVAGGCPGYHLAPWTALCGRLSSVFPMPRPDLLHDPRRTGQIGGFGRVWLSIPHAHAPAWIDTTAAGSTALLSRPSLDGVQRLFCARMLRRRQGVTRSSAEARGQQMTPIRPQRGRFGPWQGGVPDTTSPRGRPSAAVSRRCFPMPRPDLLHDPRRTGQIGGFGRVWLSIPHASRSGLDRHHRRRLLPRRSHACGGSFDVCGTLPEALVVLIQMTLWRCVQIEPG